MVRGSTPTFTVLLPVNVSEIAALLVYFVQNDKLITTIRLERMITDEKEASFTLSEEETFAFSSNSNAEMQMTLHTKGGQVLVSQIKKIPIRKKYPEEIL